MNRAPKAKPILMNSEMVLATLNGQKTQTRRIMTPQPEIKSISDLAGIACPHGDIGDLLYVRENWKIGAWNDFGHIALDYPADKYIRKEWLTVANDDSGDRLNRYRLQCTEDCEKAGLKPNQDGVYHFTPGEAPTRIRPSIHMPRWANRLTLRITDIWAQQVQDIGENDAIAEGFDLSNTEAAQTAGWYEKPQRAFQRIWEQLYGKDNWSQNPWVWVIEFEAINKNVDQVLKELEAAA